jgi:transcriptional regulator of acetoin/glycerol metabolism
VLRDIDQLSPAAARALAGALAGRPAGTLLAATAAPGGAPDAPHAALLVAFRQSAAVPPLRHRTADLPALVQDLLAELAPHRCVRPDDGALRLLLRSPWPGNVEELRGALAAALAVRPVGTIRAEDLPATCSSAPRSSLRAVDRAERDAIVAALRSAGGNKVAAATQLGLARSTLYRKIRQYGLAG